jgi:hypothetical protein
LSIVGDFRLGAWVMIWLCVPLVLAGLLAANEIWVIRTRIAAMSKMYETVPLNADSISHPNLVQLQTITEEWIQLGCVHLGDVASMVGEVESLSSNPQVDTSKTWGSMPGIPKQRNQYTIISRVLAHPESGCYGCLLTNIVARAYSSDLSFEDIVKVGGIVFAVVSVGNLDDERISFVTTTLPIDDLVWLTRHSRALGHSTPGASLQQVWRAHLADRDSLAARVGIAWDREPSLEKYFDADTFRRRQRADYFRATSFPNVIKQLLSLRIARVLGKPAPRRWMGPFENP